MPTRRTATLLTITQPDQSGGIGTRPSPLRDSRPDYVKKHLTVSHSVLDQEKGAAADGNCVAYLLCSSPAESGQNTTTGRLPSSFLEVTLLRVAIVISCGPGPELVGARPSFLRRRIGGG